MDLKNIVTTWKADLEACSPTTMVDDISALEHWATIFQDPTSLVTTIGKHLVFHRTAAVADIDAIKNDWAEQEFYTAG